MRVAGELKVDVVMDDILSRVFRLVLQENAKLAVCRRCERRGDIRHYAYIQLAR